MNQEPIWANKSAGIQFCYFLLLIVVSVSLCSLLAVLLLNPIYGISLIKNPGALNDYSDPNVIGALKMMQLFNAIGLFIVPSIVLAQFVSPKKWSYLKLSSLSKPLTAALAGALMLCALPLINYLGELNQAIQLPSFLSDVEDWMKRSEENAAQITEAFLKMNSVLDLVTNLFIVAFLAALGEELLFRAVIQKFFFKWTKNIHVAIIFTGILFSAIHLQFYGFFPRMLMGVLFGYFLLWTDSLWVPITAHFVNNGTAVLLSYLSQKKIISEDIETIGSGNSNVLLVVGSLLLTSFIAFVIYKISLNKLPENLTVSDERN